MGSSGRVLDVRVVCTSVRSFSTFGRRVAVKKWNLYTIKWHVREGTANREGYNKKYDTDGLKWSSVFHSMWIVFIGIILAGMLCANGSDSSAMLEEYYCIN